METNNFDNLCYALCRFWVEDKLENFKDNENYKYFCEFIFKFYNEIIALDTIDREDNNE